MKKLFLPLLLFLIVSIGITSVQAAKPVKKEVDTIRLDGPLGDFYAKGLSHLTLIIKDVDSFLGTQEVAIKMVRKARLYDLVSVNGGFEPGDFLGVLEVTTSFTGTTDLSMTPVTGVAVVEWVVALHADVDFGEDDLRGHWMIFYRNGVRDKQKLFGDPPVWVTPPLP